jgi:hypothetical protein
MSRTVIRLSARWRGAGGRGGGVRRLGGAAVVVLSLILVALVSLEVGRTPRQRSVSRPPAPPARHGVIQSRPGPDAVVSIVSGGKLVRVPHAFLGLSTEYWAVPMWRARISVIKQIFSILHVPGDAPLVLRVGGDSADQAFWDPSVRKLPEWVVELTSQWLSQTRTLVRDSGVKLILDLNLVTASPQIATQAARAAMAALPSSSIAGFEIGNEPDLYSRGYWLAVTSPDNSFGIRALPAQISASDYAGAFGTYARLLATVAPKVPLLGPAVGSPSVAPRWIATLIADPHPGLQTVSMHRYPYDACAPLGASNFPTVARLRSANASAGMARTVQTDVEIAHRAGLTFRLTELNSVTCGGSPNVSDTFATALWAPDALFELVRVGVDAVNIHVRPGTINAAFSLTRRGIVARPLLYGLALFARTLGPGAQMVPLRVRALRPLQLNAWAIRVRGDVLNVLLINKGTRPATVALRLPVTGRAAVQRLLAPSATSRSNVTLDGMHLTVGGRWQGTRATETIRPGAEGYELALPQMSAALVTTQLRPERAHIAG